MLLKHAHHELGWRSFAAAGSALRKSWSGKRLSTLHLVHLFRVAPAWWLTQRPPCARWRACRSVGDGEQDSSTSSPSTGYSSVGRASDCRDMQLSDGPWFDSGWPEICSPKCRVRPTSLLVVSAVIGRGTVVHFLLQRDRGGKPAFRFRRWAPDPSAGLVAYNAAGRGNLPAICPKCRRCLFLGASARGSVCVNFAWAAAVGFSAVCRCYCPRRFNRTLGETTCLAAPWPTGSDIWSPAPLA